ncbi:MULTISPECIES: hypothetical protein [unclassified Schlesneria]|uniref:hypothetical protein n=1 Tax=Schlesneria TaxID=656899 RepID=UPI002EF3EFDA
MNNEQRHNTRHEHLNLEAHERELRHALNKAIRWQRERDQAITLAARVCVAGSIPSILWSLAVQSTSAMSLDMGHWISVLFCVASIAMMAAAAGVISGFLAAWWFNNTLFPIPPVAIALALLCDAVLFCWVLRISL